ncbi:hypothetical protein RBSWK_03146 [Rhodopirellula baltica SWK14]|uniref:Uncharacterized protein n=1 Tax=Rhodopirellula baltica SWK14 TaxID=993516 RepID=L7CIM8_RHOBT|nr:hypothetical protein RBSWK_03146 [Rhodopirellula baltica SWK14]
MAAVPSNLHDERLLEVIQCVFGEESVQSLDHRCQCLDSASPRRIENEINSVVPPTPLTEEGFIEGTLDRLCSEIALQFAIVVT